MIVRSKIHTPREVEFNTSVMRKMDESKLLGFLQCLDNRELDAIIKYLTVNYTERRNLYNRAKRIDFIIKIIKGDE